MKQPTQIEEIIADPQAHFESPAEVLHEPDLSVHLKQKILENWKAEASHMARSTAESMGGGEPDHLREITQALLKLNEQSVIAPRE